MDIELIKMFHVALSDEKKVDFKTLNEKAILSGYIVHPDACTESVLEFIEQQYTDPNSTFYKTWEDITSKNRLELFIDQIVHYASTYGTDFTDTPYIPNNRESDIPDLKNYKLILPITRKELIKKCVDTLSSKIALKSETVMILCDFLCEEKIDTYIIDSLANKEAICYLCFKLNFLPKDKFNLFRYIIYQTTGSLLIIKNKELIDKIAYSPNKFDFNVLSEEQLIVLSSIFFRFKELFLAFKKRSIYGKETNNAPIINKLRRLAKKHHQPLKESIWNHIFSGNPEDALYITSHIEELSTFKIVSLMQLCLIKLQEPENNLYLIRNQKIFLREGYKPHVSKKYVKDLYTFLNKELISRISKKLSSFDHKFTFKSSPYFHVSCPTSEKNFIGNYPFGTYYDLSNHNYICCYWRNEWGVNDLDLSFCDARGFKIGWNAEYNENGLLYSGDMTTANPEATEIIYFSKEPVKGIVKVNEFSGNEKYSFRMLFGQEEIKDLKRNYMIDPNSIKFSVDIDSAYNENIIGIVGNNRFILSNINSGNAIVSKVDPNGEKLMNSLLLKTCSSIPLDGILREAGAKEVDVSYKESVDLDLTQLNKDDLIKLFS